MAEDKPEADLPVTAEKPTLWARDHKIVFTNAFSLRLGDNDISIEFSTEQTIADKQVYLSQLQVMMTPKSAKILSLVLNNALEQLEKLSGAPITLPPDKIAELNRSFIARPPTDKPK